MLCLFLRGRVGVWLVEDVDVYVDDERGMVMLDECLSFGSTFCVHGENCPSSLCGREIRIGQDLLRSIEINRDYFQVPFGILLMVVWSCSEKGRLSIIEVCTKFKR